MTALSKTLEVLKEALSSNEQKDYTKVSINKAIVLLSIPMVIEMFFEALFAIVDAFFVANYVGVVGVATIGLTEAVLSIIYSIAWGLSSAATAIIARRVGEKDTSGAAKSVYQVIFTALFIGVLLGCIGFIFSEKILLLMGASSELVLKGGWYTKISFISSPIIILLFALCGAMRGSGNAAVAMRAVILANLINIGLDALFITYFKMGVEGAALATLIGRSIGVIYLFYGMFYVEKRLLLQFKSIKIDWGIIKNILKVTSGGAGQFIIQSCSWIFLTRILSIYGSEVVAGYTIAIRIIIFTILPSWGMANAAATLVGQNLGADQPKRAENSVWRVALFNTVFLVLVSILLIGFSKEIIYTFDSTARVVEVGSLCLIVLSAGYVFFGSGMIIPQALNGAGDTFTPTILNFVCFWIIEIPLAYYLAVYLDFKEQGVFYSIIISESILALAAIVIFKAGNWKSFKV